MKIFFKISVPKNYEIFTGKHRYWSQFLIKLQASKFAGAFFVNIAKFLRTGCFIEHVWWLLLKIVKALKRQNRKIRTAATISTIYMRFLNNLFIFGVLASAAHFSSTFLTLICMNYFRSVNA